VTEIERISNRLQRRVEHAEKYLQECLESGRQAGVENLTSPQFKVRAAQLNRALEDYRKAREIVMAFPEILKVSQALYYAAKSGLKPDSKTMKTASGLLDCKAWPSA